MVLAVFSRKMSFGFGRIQQEDVCSASKATVMGDSDLLHQFVPTVCQSEGESKTKGIALVCSKSSFFKFKVYRKHWEKRKESPGEDLWEKIFFFFLIICSKSLTLPTGIMG